MLAQPRVVPSDPQGTLVVTVASLMVEVRQKCHHGVLPEQALVTGGLPGGRCGAERLGETWLGEIAPAALQTPGAAGQSVEVARQTKCHPCSSPTVSTRARKKWGTMGGGGINCS